MYAYCWQSGKIDFSAKVPEGAIMIAEGSAKKLKDKIMGCARLAYDNKTWLVPGVPMVQTWCNVVQIWHKTPYFVSYMIQNTSKIPKNVMHQTDAMWCKSGADRLHFCIFFCIAILGLKPLIYLQKFIWQRSCDMCGFPKTILQKS